MIFSRFGLLLLALALCWGALPSFAQSDRQRFERQMDQIRQQTLELAPTDVPVDQRAFIDYGAYFLLDYLSVDDSHHDNHVLRQYSFVPYVRLNVDNAQEVFVRGRLAYRDFNDQDSFDGRGDEFLDPDADRAYYRFDLARYREAYSGKKAPYNLVLQGGRDFNFWGNGLVLGQVLDGFNAVASVGPLSLALVAGVTPTRTVDIDASRPTFDHNTRRGFYGGMIALEVGQHRPYAYGIVQRDYNDQDVSTFGSITTHFQYDSYYIGLGSTGALTDKLQYGVEFVYQGGETQSNSFRVEPPFLVGVPQTRDNIEAWAADARLDYLFNDPARSRVSAEFLIASGDSDRLSGSNTFGGNRPGTTDRGFNGFGLLNTGLAFAPEASNLLALRLGVSTFPLQQFHATRQLQTGFDFFIYGKTDRNAPINEQTFDQRYLGVEPDLFINWQITSDITLAARYGVFFPSSKAFPLDDARQFLLLTATFAF